MRNPGERQILGARAEGKLSGPAGEGRALPARPGAAPVGPGLAAGHRIMAEAGMLPEGFAPKENLAAARRSHAGPTDPDARRKAMKKIADLEMRHHIARDARRKFMT